MSASTLLSKNVYKHFSPSASDKQIMMVAKFLVPVLALIAVYCTLTGGNTIVALLLMGYSMVTQLFPSFIASLSKNNFVTKQGAMAGIIAGLAAVGYTTITKATVGSLFPAFPQVIKDLNVGPIALIINVLVMVIVSFGTQSISAANFKKENKSA